MNHRRAFTLVELLATIAIVGVLMALLMPAVSASREAGRRALCLNNLRQFGVAMANYEDTHHYLAPGGSDLPGSMASAQVRLLPFLDSDELAAQAAAEGERRQSLAQGATDLVTVAVFHCPSASGGSRVGGTNYFSCFGPGGRMYRGPVGSGNTLIITPPGAIGEHFRRQRDLARGASHVAAFSERIFGDGADEWLDPRRDIVNFPQPPTVDYFLNVSDVPPELQWTAVCGKVRELVPVWGRHNSHAGFSWQLPGLGYTWYTHGLPPNSAIPDCQNDDSPTFPVKAIAARSEHPGGVNVLYCDGRVEFTEETIDLKLWRQLSLINDKDDRP